MEFKDFWLTKNNHQIDDKFIYIMNNGKMEKYERADSTKGFGNKVYIVCDKNNFAFVSEQERFLYFKENN